METEKPNSPTRPRRFQFGLLGIFVLVTICAAIAGLVRLFDVPPLVRYAFAVYLMLLVAPLLRFMWSLSRAHADLKRMRAEMCATAGVGR